MMDTVAEIVAAVKEGNTTAGAVAQEVGRRLATPEVQQLNATLDWSQEVLDGDAARADGAAAPGPLAGVPIAIKDNIVTIEQPTTCASRILQGYRSPYDATVVDRLRAAGALIGIKTNLDEFAMGSSTEHSAYGRVLNPLDHSRVPGGSSGGSAALVAAGVVPAALGSETGGSVRQPASFCGVVGVKPGYGRVSRFGLVAFGSSLDCISVFGRTVADAASVLQVISGPDRYDATTVSAPAMAAPARRQDLAGVTIGLPKECFPGDLDPGIRAACDRTVGILRDLGAEVRDVSLPHTPYAVAAYYVINPAEASANLARYDGVRYGQRRGDGVDVGTLYRTTRGEGFGPEVKRRIIIGTYVLSAGYYDAYYTKAQQVRALIANDFDRLFREEGISYLFTPTTPTVAFRAGERTDDPVQMYLADIFVAAVSLAGLPALSLPIGRSGGLPVGGHVIGPQLGETELLEIAAVIEGAVPATEEALP
ncbi:MAG: Asp-tRNA(Asn)/Glu-tRNA(Gln) amidotransferase subunit GatA [Gemmatimonadetes bacterium]|nr:Asp-tRNA(Asn)/Glu-tRNA(Gln) amidotransferase subunit GatA [Gemmatimonadota bacterium]